MRRIGAATLLACAAAVPAAPCHGQSLEAFEIETIVDPTVLEISDGDQPVWLDFFGLYLQSGYSENYQTGPRFTGEGVAFGDLQTTYIHRNLQVSARWTGFDGSGLPGSPRRWELALGRYLDLDDSSTEGIDRVQLSLARTESPSALDRTYWSLDYTFLQPGTESEKLLEPPFDTIVRLRLSWARGGLARLSPRSEPMEDGLPQPDGSERVTVQVPDVYQLSLESRSRTARGFRGLVADFGLGLGTTYSDRSNWQGSARAEIRLEYRLWDDRLRLVGVYAPAYLFDANLAGRHWNHETTVFVHLPLLFKAFRPPWHNGSSRRR